jgi:hypothetical protein
VREPAVQNPAKTQRHINIKETKQHHGNRNSKVV